MRAAVIGAGWAGLTAALTLRRAGMAVDTYEAAPRTGGRARSITLKIKGHPPLTLDNGQHVLLGAYRHTWRQMRELGIRPEQACYCRPLSLRHADDRLRLRLWPLPAPAHALGALFASHGLEGFRGRYHLWRLLQGLRPPARQPRHGQTVAQWLDAAQCPPALKQRLWGPLCLAAMNTPVEIADARLFARVLHDSLAAGPQASRLYIPRGGLDELWPAAARRRLGNHLYTGHRISRLERDSGGRWAIAGRSYDHVVLAVPEPVARQLVRPLPEAESWLGTWPALSHAAIGTVTLLLKRPWNSGLDMVALRDAPASGDWGQWLFDRSATASRETPRRCVHIVISDAQRYAGQPAKTVTEGVIRQLRAQVAIPLPEIVSAHLVTEKKATFQALPGLKRPGPATPWRGLFLAGDWTDTGYPAVLEGAIISGKTAARHVLRA